MCTTHVPFKLFLILILNLYFVPSNRTGPHETGNVYFSIYPYCSINFQAEVKKSLDVIILLSSYMVVQLQGCLLTYELMFNKTPK